MKNNALLPCITTLVLLFVAVLCQYWKIAELQATYDKVAEDQLIEQVNTENTWKISYQQAYRKGNISEIAASDNYIYLAYSSSSCVDVYSHSGEFQYTMLLPDSQNGGVNIRYDDNQLFVLDKRNTLYVFDGIQEIERMDYDQAISRGYSWSWFEEAKCKQKNDGTFYIEMDEAGNEVRKILLPNQNRSINIFRIVIFVFAILLHLFSLLRYLTLKHINQGQ